MADTPLDPDEHRRSKVRPEWKCPECGEHYLNPRCTHPDPWQQLQARIEELKCKPDCELCE